MGSEITIMNISEYMPFILSLLGLILIVFSNNIMGTFISLADGSFDKEISKKGLIKATGILLGLMIGYVAGIAVPDMSIGMINGESMTMMQAVSAIVTGAYALYAYKFVQKCIEALQLKITISSIAQDGEIDNVSSSQRGS